MNSRKSLISPEYTFKISKARGIVELLVSPLLGTFHTEFTSYFNIVRKLNARFSHTSICASLIFGMAAFRHHLPFEEIVYLELSAHDPTRSLFFGSKSQPLFDLVHYPSCCLTLILFPGSPIWTIQFCAFVLFEHPFSRSKATPKQTFNFEKEVAAWRRSVPQVLNLAAPATCLKFPIPLFPNVERRHSYFLHCFLYANFGHMMYPGAI
ncbi:uncharacterized protein BDR25DRAFT_356637 [Lindgomyces ingoldianus]|uniref:Uncharacterized protein n=1 Tax=Lindgomyces ingoldianus TaxID=673940 RepID=A0ACB6QS58_9PLEO|nr:uncharacterized protein BDR25DRAFT_356637 [Lindgomyces ingoldianus]KAF2469403.1 hypothetical protein BDR25DRAFT_356637 [Lindgomyces ingoldianus]